jgi:NADPH2:quinone reductase
MRALVCEKVGPIDDLVVKEIADPIPVAGEVAIDVHACGINFPDLLIAQGKYQFKPSPPFSPGGELSGVVHALGDGVPNLSVGDRVVAALPYGALADRVIAPAAVVYRAPSIAHDVAACVLTTYGTAWHALVDRARIARGEWLLVLGAGGGVGVAAIQVGKLLGARVIAAARGADKLAFCREQGADAVIDYATEDLKARVKEITGAGADVVCDSVGGAMTEAALRSIAWNGRLLVVGFTAGEIPKVPTNLCLLKGASIVGVFWGSFVMREPIASRAQIETVLDHVARGALTPQIHARFPLDRAVDAMRELEARRVKGKAVVMLRS